MLKFSETATIIIKTLLWAKKQGEPITHQDAIYLWGEQEAWEELVEDDYLVIKNGIVIVTKKGLTWYCQQEGTVAA